MGVMTVVPSLVICLAVAVAVAPWGAGDGARFVMPLLPYMAAHIFLARGVGVVPSPVVFLAGLAMDLATHGPLGFWPLVYLVAALVMRRLPGALLQSVVGRLGALAMIVVVLIMAQVAFASLYQFDWVALKGVAGGTLLAAVLVALVDLVWREARDERRLNVTQRGGGAARGG